LPDKDREAVFTRFYRQGSYPEVARVLQIKEEAAKKRVQRALEKLRRFFTNKGVVLSVTGLSGLLAANSVQAAPAGLASSASTTALAGVAGTLASTTSTLMLAKGALHAMFIAKLKTAAAVTAACAVVTGTSVVVAQKVAQPPQPGTLKLSEFVAVTAGLDGLQGRWLGQQPPQELGGFATTTPPLTWQVRPGSTPANFWLVGQNESERDKQGIWEFKVRVTPDTLWLSAAHGTQAPYAWLEYIQKPGEVRLIRTAWRAGALDPAQRVDLRAVTLAKLKVQNPDQVRRFLGPLLAHFNAAELAAELPEELLARWLRAMDAGDLDAYRQCLHTGTRKVNESGTAEAMKFWTKQMNDLRQDGFKGEWEFRKPAEVNERFPAGAVQAFPIVPGKPSREFILLLQENRGWVIVRLFSGIGRDGPPGRPFAYRCGAPGGRALPTTRMVNG
jgi:hypothetical protein